MIFPLVQCSISRCVERPTDADCIGICLKGKRFSVCLVRLVWDIARHVQVSSYSTIVATHDAQSISHP